MRRNSVAFGIGLNMAKVEMLHFYVITEACCHTVCRFAYEKGVQRASLRNDAMHTDASIAGSLATTVVVRRFI